MKNALSKIALLVFQLSLVGCSLLAQNYLNFKTWSTPEELGGGYITDLEQDEMGYLWVATSKGLYRFDGHQFYLLQFMKNGEAQLPQANFANVFRDSKGLIWVGSMERGLYLIDPVLERVSNFRTGGTDSTSIFDNRIKQVFEDGIGRIWVGFHKEGFCQFDRENGQCGQQIIPSQLLNDQSNSRLVDDVLCFHYQAPYLWVGTLLGLVRFHPETGEMRHFLPHLPSNVDNPAVLDGYESTVRQIFPDGTGNFWLANFNGGLLHFNPETGRSKVFKFTEDPKTDLTTSVLLRHSADKTWLATNEGLAILKNSTGELEFFNKKNFNSNLSAEAIVELYYDHNGSLWAAGRHSLHHLSKERNLFPSFGLPFEPYTAKMRPGTSEIFISAYLQRDFAIFNTKDSSLQMHGYRPVKEKGINCIHHFQFTKNGEVMAVENTDIFHWDEASQKMQPYLLTPFIGGRDEPDKALLFSMLDSRGTLWAGTKNDGLFKINLSEKSVTAYRNKDGNDNYPLVYNGYVNHFFEDTKGHIWYGTERGFGRYEYERDSFINYPYPTYQTGDPDILFKHVYGIAEDRLGRIWIGSNRKGLGYLQPENDDVLHIRSFTTKDGLRSDGIRQILTDEVGDLWLSTEAGLSRLRMNDMVFENYGFEYGISDFPRLSLSPDGSILATGEQCFFRFWPDNIRLPFTQPEVRIWSFKIFYKEFSAGKNINYVDEINLAHGQNNFSFEFGAINFFNPELTEYAYQLVGLDEDWVVTNDRNFASYTNVDGGQYTFRLKARTEGGEWGGEKSVTLHIALPYWEQWWFRLLVIVGIGLFLFAAYAYRVRQIRKQEKLKTEFNKQLAEVEMTALRAQMNPHFLFNCLNSIKLFIVKNNSEAASIYLTKFARLIRLILQNSKHHLVPLADEIEALQLYIELEKMRFRNQFVCEIDLPENIATEKTRIPPLLLQPFVENAIWHGLVHEDRPNKLLISVRQEGTGLLCTIEDNGIGRQAAQASRKNSNARQQSLGMAITENRIILTKTLYGLNTEIRVLDLVEPDGCAAGTRVEIFIPTEALD